MGTQFIKYTPRFAAYSVCFILLRSWITFNEPWCSTVLGYANGEMAPGKKVTSLGGWHLNMLGTYMFPCVPFFSLIVGPKIFLNKMSTTCHKSFELKCGCCIWIPMAISGFWLLGKTGETRHRAVPGCTPHHPLACSSSDLIKQMQTHSEDLRRSQKISEGIATTEPLLLLLLILRASLLALFVSTGRPTHFLILR